MNEEKIVKNFLNDLFNLYDLYNLTIAHEDFHGGFIIDFNTKNKDYNKKWLTNATVWHQEESVKKLF